MANRKKIKHNTQAPVQMINMESFIEEDTAINPANVGATADPPCSTKYWIAFAVLLTSGSVMSYTVDMTFGEAMV